MKNFLRKILPFLKWLPELKDRSVLKADIVAGLTVALVLIPQSMAYAQLAGLPPQNGLYASIVPVLFAAFFGSSRQLATGPVAIVSIMVGSVLGPAAILHPGMILNMAVLLALFSGILYLILYTFKLGVLVNFISHPVMIGFTNAAAIIIALSQVEKLFGVKSVKSEYFIFSIWKTCLSAYHSIHIQTFIFGLLAFLSMLALKKINKKLPGVLIVVAVSITVSYFLKFAEHGGKVVGFIPSGLPFPAIPIFDPSLMKELIFPAFVVTFLGAMEAISISKAMAIQTRQRLNTNQELLGQGLANIAAGFFGAYPVSGSFSRSAVNLTSGARTAFSSVVTVLIVAVTLFGLTPLLFHLPQAVLAAVIVMAVTGLFRLQPMKDAFKVHPHEGVVALITFFATLALAPQIDKGILVGVGLSLALYLFRIMRPTVERLVLAPSGQLAIAKELRAEWVQSKESDPYALLRFDGSLFFLSSSYFEENLLELLSEKPNLKYLVLCADRINRIDYSGIESLEQARERMHSAGVKLLLAGFNQEIITQLGYFHFEPKAADGPVFFAESSEALRWIYDDLARKSGHDFMI